MKLYALGLKHFTRYEEFKANFDSKINVVVGENAAGKTSILDALAYLFTGRCDRTDKGGKGAEHMIQVGAKQADIAAIVAANGNEPVTFSRGIPGGLSIDDHAGNNTALQGFLNDYLGVDDRVITAALSSTGFLDMRPADQKGLLFGLLGLSFDRKDVTERVMECFGTDHEVQVHRMLNAAPDKLYDGTGATFANLYKHFYELRKNTKRRLKDMGAVPALTVAENHPPKDEIEEQLGELRRELAEKRTALGIHEGGVTSRERLKQEIERLTADLENAGSPGSARRQLEALDEKLDEYKHGINGKKTEARSLADAAEALGAAGATKSCPLAPGLITCPLGKEKRKKLVGELENKRADLEKDIGEIEDAMGLLLPRRVELVAEAANPGKKELEADIETLEDKLAALSSGDIDPDETRDEIRVLQDRITNGQGILANINKAEGRQEELDRQAGEREKLEDQVEVLELLVEILSPKGLPGRILGETIGPIEKNANERLQELTGGRYSLALQVDPDFKVFITHDGVTSDLSLLSSSEKLRVGVVLQDAIVRLSGLRFLVIDNVDVLDPANRLLLMDLLVSIKGDYDSILVLSTVGANGVSDPGIDDLTVWRLEDGKLGVVS